MEIKEREFLGFKVFFRSETVDEAVIDHSFGKDIFYPAIPDFRPGESPIILDVGAHIGTFSLLSALKFKNAVIHAFEPFNESFSLLERNIEANNLSSIYCYNVAVTNTTGFVDLYLDQDNWGHSTSSELGSKSQKVKSILLDDFLKDKIDICDLIKFNCEGAEFEIVLSIKSERLKKIGMMIILYHEDLSKGNSIRNVYKYLDENNFSCRIVNNKEGRGWLIAKNKTVYKFEFSQFLLETKMFLRELRTRFSRK